MSPERSADKARDRHREQRRKQLVAIEQADDPRTIQRLEHLEIAADWQCLEIAAGGGSIARWLHNNVGMTGRVVATDLDTHFLRQSFLREHHEVPGLEIREHDVVRDSLEEQAFDLVHTRHLLANLPGRVPAFKKMIAAVKPGGWILIEELDFATGQADPATPPALRVLYQQMLEIILRYTRLQGADPNFGSRAHGLLRHHGFEAVEAEGHTRIFQGDPTVCTTQQLSFLEFRQPLVDAGKVTEEDYDDFLALYDNPAFAWWGELRVATWGQKPLTASSL